MTAYCFRPLPNRQSFMFMCGPIKKDWQERLVAANDIGIKRTALNITDIWDAPQ